MTIETVRELMNANPPSPTDGYAQEVRDGVARYARQRREDGVLWSVLEAEVGVSSTSMRNWMRMLVPARFHQVMVVDEAEPIGTLPLGPLTITSPSGFVLAGFDLDQAVAVLRGLR